MCLQNVAKCKTENEPQSSLQLQWRCTTGGTLRETRARAGGDAEAGCGHSESADILLRLEEDDMDLWSEETAQYHRPAQTDRDAHGGGLHLKVERNRLWGNKTT